LIIDVHAHHAPTALVQSMAEAKKPTGRIANAPIPWEERFQHMTDAGVGRQVLSIARGFYSENLSLAQRCARGVNDEFSHLCATRPQQLSFWASLPLPHVEATLLEIDRALALPGCAGVLINCFVLERSLADPLFDAVYAELDRRHAIVFLHPSQNGVQSPLINDWGLTVCAGASIEDSIAALHLIRREIPRRFPHVRFIVPHFGGLLPMLLNRLDGQMPQEGFLEVPSTTARRFFYDTVGWGSKAALKAAVEAFGAQQLLPGSDYPILLPWESYPQTFRHIAAAGLEPTIIEQILHRNAQQLLQLE
jgi:predicted TIM-barrel fold metal-dependent hydrolase